MKFIASSKKLHNAASAVSKVINAKNALTILNNFLFEIKDSELTLSASDSETTLSAKVELSSAEGDIRFCVDARRLVDLLKELPDSGMEFEIDTDTFAVKVVCAGGEFDFAGLSGDEYPSFKSPDASEENSLVFTAPTRQLLDGIDTTLFAVSSDDLRPQMMGILWDINEEGIIFVSTDTRKLVRYINNTSAPGVTGKFIFPVKPVSILKNVFAGEESVEVVLTPNAARFKGDCYTLTCQYIKGNFPDYNRVIPTTNPYILTVDRQLLLNAIRRVAVFVESNHGLVKCKLTPERLIMKVQDNNYCARAQEIVECEYEGNEMVIGFGAPYLLEVISTLPGEKIVIKLADPSRPGVFMPAEQAENCDLLMLLMPMSVTEF